MATYDPPSPPRDRKNSSTPKPAAPERVAAFNTGLSAESRAAALLIAKGHRIVARRTRTPAGEIDIIVRRRDVLVFVEVKARASFDDAAYAVTPRQRQRIVAAAEAWLAEWFRLGDELSTTLPPSDRTAVQILLDDRRAKDW